MMYRQHILITVVIHKYTCTCGSRLSVSVLLSALGCTELFLLSNRYLVSDNETSIAIVCFITLRFGGSLRRNSSIRPAASCLDSFSEPGKCYFMKKNNKKNKKKTTTNKTKKKKQNKKKTKTCIIPML